LNHQERQARIESYGKAYDRLIAALETLPKEMWQFKPAPDDWSIHEQIIHLADSEANSYSRVRRGIAEPGSAVLGYDQDRWASNLNYHAQSCEEALQLFKLLRLMSYRLIVSLPDDTWAHTIEHSENGTMTLDDWLVVYDDHVLGHIQQMQANYEAWLQAPKAF